MRLQSQEPRPFWSLQEDCHPHDFQPRKHTKYSLVLKRLLPRSPDSIEIQKGLLQKREPSGSSCCAPLIAQNPLRWCNVRIAHPLVFRSLSRSSSYVCIKPLKHCSAFATK